MIYNAIITRAGKYIYLTDSLHSIDDMQSRFYSHANLLSKLLRAMANAWTVQRGNL